MMRTFIEIDKDGIISGMLVTSSPNDPGGGLIEVPEELARQLDIGQIAPPEEDRLVW